MATSVPRNGSYVGSPGIRAVAVGELDGDDLPDLVTAGAGPGSSGSLRFGSTREIRT